MNELTNQLTNCDYQTSFIIKSREQYAYEANRLIGR
jgi:hypothetical protein